jgi:hypothetical protein
MLKRAESGSTRRCWLWPSGSPPACRRLRAPAPRPAPWRIAALLAVLVLTAASTLLAAHNIEQLFELAKHAYLALRH